MASFVRDVDGRVVDQSYPQETSELIAVFAVFTGVVGGLHVFFSKILFLDVMGLSGWDGF